jgi:hypothetical protein
MGFIVGQLKLFEKREMKRNSKFLLLSLSNNIGYTPKEIIDIFINIPGMSFPGLV